MSRVAIYVKGSFIRRRKDRVWDRIYTKYCLLLAIILITAKADNPEVALVCPDPRSPRNAQCRVPCRENHLMTL